MPVSVSDARSNAPEQIVHAAESIGRSKDRLAIFLAIYRGKKKVKTVTELKDTTHLSRIRVLQVGGWLAAQGIVHQEKVEGETAYRKDPFYSANRSRILSYVRSPEKRKAAPTKRSPAGVKVATITMKIPRGLKLTPPRHVAIDDIDSFKKVRKVKAAGNLPASVSEARFKKGLLRILNQGGRFRDWGGEHSDIYTGRLVYKGKRRLAAFALKGPGLKTKLTPARMGKNGDQAQRLLSEPAEFFVVQHWREIDASVVALVRELATAKATLGGGPIYYVIMDGQESMRLFTAYSSLFGNF